MAVNCICSTAFCESVVLRQGFSGFQLPPQARYARQLPQGDANPLRRSRASSPEGGALFVLTGRCKKAPPSGELARRKP